MSLPAPALTDLYAELEALPENLVGEIIDGELYAQPRLLDPIARTLETFALDNGRWVVTGQFKDDEVVSVAPFEALNLELANLWVPEPEQTDASQAEGG